MKIMNKSTSKILSILLLLFIVSASWTGVKAQYWEAKGKGIHAGNLYYLVDEIAHTAIVTNRTMASTGSDAGSNSYSGSIIIPNEFESDGETYTVIGIQDFAFYGSTNLRSVEIPASVTTIGTQVFDDCGSVLQEITVSPQNQNFYAKDGVLYDKYQTELIFCAKNRTGRFTVPSDVQKIHEFAFNKCTGITEIVLPNGLTEIGAFAFTDCSNMTSINIPTGLKKLGDNAFRNATALSSNINLPASLTSIGNDVFRYCRSLTNVTFSEGITSIGAYAFNGCSALTSIELPGSLTTLGISSFANTGLTSITIPNGITDVPAAAFSNCKLTSITLPKGLLTISGQAFNNNPTTINEVRIPESVTSIANNAFNGTNVKNFYINNIPRHIRIGDSNPFKNAEDTKIHVFTLTKNIFENAENWSKYAGRFVADIDITHVESITLDNENMIVLTTATGKLNATINPEDAHVKDVTYTSSNENIILISNPTTGDFVAGATEGTATITCTAEDGSGKYATCEVRVVKSFTPAESVTLNKTEHSMEVGNTLKLTATIAPANATYQNIMWRSDDEDIATVSNSGIVTAKAPGVATITAISGDGNARAKCKVSVSYGNLTLTDGVEYTNDAVLPVRKLTYTRNFSNTSWQALYIPFRMSYDDWKDKFDVAKLLNVHSYDNDGDGEVETLDIEIVRIKEGTLKENHPYLIKAKNTGDQTITINNATIYPAESNSIQCASTENTCDFRGAYVKTSVPYEGGHVLKSGAFKKSGPTATINPYRYYMQITAKDGQLVKITNAKIIEVDEFGFEETTAINSVESDQDNVTAVYNANGIKQASTKQGLNIVKMADGTTKKIFVK